MEKDLHSPFNHYGEIIHIQPDILVWKVKWVLGSITTNKASGSDGIPVSYFKSWKMMLWKCCTQYVSKLGKLSSGHRTERSVFIPIQKKGSAKVCANHCKIPLISHASKVVLKILQARLQQHVNWELPDVQAGFIKYRRTRDQIASIPCIIEKARKFRRKTSTSASLTTLKLLTVWNNLWKILK